jgi:NAD(P)-dependent dehydrogenase (short-subunit alcohol dehydrogenase family)
LQPQFQEGITMTDTTATTDHPSHTRTKPHLKPLSEQVVVILGASSGIGRMTAQRLATSGAKVVVAARSEPGLDSLAAEINDSGGQAIAVPCDVTDIAQVEEVAVTAVEAFGRIDTWVNVASVSVYATFEETSLEEFRRIIDVNLMGYVHGAKVALPHLRAAGSGGPDRHFLRGRDGVAAVAQRLRYLQACHRGLVDALRRELMAKGVPISVTSIKPASINTPFFNNARSKMGVKPQGAPPIYEPGVVANCVLYAATHPVRDLYAGGAGKVLALNQIVAPGILDKLLARFGIPLQQTDEPASTHDALETPRLEEDRIRGDFSDKARRFSLHTWLQTHPGMGRAMGLAAAGFVGLKLLLARR